MLDIGWQELFLIAVVALVVVGPKDLPAAMRALARIVGKARGLSRDFQNSLSDMVREAELDELRQKVQQVQRYDIGAEIKNSLDPGGTLRKEFDPTGFAGEERRPADKQTAPDTPAAVPEQNDIPVEKPVEPSGTGSTTPSRTDG